MPRHPGTRAKVRTCAKTQMRLLGPRNVEQVRLGETPFVAVGCSDAESVLGRSRSAVAACSSSWRLARAWDARIGGRSEEISQICVVWGKAVAVSRYHLSPHTRCPVGVSGFAEQGILGGRFCGLCVACCDTPRLKSCVPATWKQPSFASRRPCEIRPWRSTEWMAGRPAPSLQAHVLGRGPAPW